MLLYSSSGPQISSIGPRHEARPSFEHLSRDRVESWSEISWTGDRVLEIHKISLGSGHSARHSSSTKGSYSSSSTWRRELHCCLLCTWSLKHIRRLSLFCRNVRSFIFRRLLNIKAFRIPPPFRDVAIKIQHHGSLMKVCQAWTKKPESERP